MADPESVRSNADAMTSEEYRDAIGRLELSQGEAARLLGVDARTSRRWANKEREVPPTVARFLRFLLAKGLPAAAVFDAIGPDAQEQQEK